MSAERRTPSRITAATFFSTSTAEDFSCAAKRKVKAFPNRMTRAKTRASRFDLPGVLIFFSCREGLLPSSEYRFPSLHQPKNRCQKPLLPLDFQVRQELGFWLPARWILVHGPEGDASEARPPPAKDYTFR